MMFIHSVTNVTLLGHTVKRTVSSIVKMTMHVASMKNHTVNSPPCGEKYHGKDSRQKVSVERTMMDIMKIAKTFALKLLDGSDRKM
mmetsp:Transcript_29432/g.73870  ORF Transcript_29432/g.73870 Transcript_29432/m.73870 type:complete len:86 (-) Transcript_29432:1589-1846(-)